MKLGSSFNYSQYNQVYATETLLIVISLHSFNHSLFYLWGEEEKIVMEKDIVDQTLLTLFFKSLFSSI